MSLTWPMCALPRLPSTFTLCRARLLDCSGMYDVRVQDGQIAIVSPSACTDAPPGRALSPESGEPWPPRSRADRYDLGGRLLLPGFVDIHMHLDKALTLPVTHNTSGTLAGAIQAFERYLPSLTPEDVFRRTLRVATMALPHGTTTIRTHINFHGRAYVEQVLEGIQAARDALRGRLDLQVVLMCPVEEHPEVGFVLKEKADQFVAVGGAPHLSRRPLENLRWMVDLAVQNGLSLDVHADETLNPDMRTLDHLVRLRSGLDFPSPVIAGHCVSLDAMPEEDAKELSQRVAEAGIGVVALPGANLYLQGRDDRSGVRRGVTRIRLLQRCGVRVAAASDNVQDVFHPYGRGDLIDAALLTAYCGHFLPEEAGEVLNMISLVPGQLAVHRNYGIREGSVADMVVLDEGDPLSALQTLSPNRWVFKRGVLVAAQAGDAWLSEGPLADTEDCGVLHSGESATALSE